jgi:hypothetical protein
MKKLFLLGLIGGFLGAVTSILVVEAFVSEKNTLAYIGGALLSVTISAIITKKLYTEYLKSTSTSRAAINDTAKLLKNRG